MASTPTVERRPLRRPRSEALLEARRRELRREREVFGGRIQWEAVFFGLLAAVGLAACLVAAVLGALLAAGVISSHESADGLVDQIMAGGGAISLGIVALAYLTGGYVAARMARFDGWRQGLGTWLLSLFAILAAGITVWIAGGELDPTKSISLPGNPVGEGPLHQGIAVIAPVLVVIPLLAALAGGVLGDRFHRAVDRTGTEEFEAVPPSAGTHSHDEPGAGSETGAETETRIA